MGACYFVPREFFFRIGGLRTNWLWGADEPVLSLKTWLAGGDVRLLKNVRVGHKFRSREEVTYQTDSAAIIYNKLRGLAVTLPEKNFLAMRMRLVKKPGYEQAKQKFYTDLQDILFEREEFQKVAVRDIGWFTEKFGVTIPG